MTPHTENTTSTLGAPVRVATYTRHRADTSRQPSDLRRQQRRLDAYLASHTGWQVVASYHDTTGSAAKRRRGLRQAITDAHAGRYDMLLVDRLDRISRHTSGLHDLIGELGHAGVTFHAYDDGVDTSTPAGRLMITLFGLVAEFEQQRNSQITDRDAGRHGSYGGDAA